jgi:spermidine synthase
MVGLINAANLRLRAYIMLALFTVSAAGLVLQIALTRIFALYFQYHYTFLAVSIAIFGLSLGAASARLYAIGEEKFFSRITLTLGLLAGSFVMMPILIAWLPSAGSVWLHVLIALFPFGLIGYFAAVIFAHLREIGGLLYGVDLVGAATGTILVIGLLTVLSPFSTVMLLGLFCGILAAVFASEAQWHRALAGATLGSGLIAVLLIANLATGLFDFNPSRLTDPPRDKTMLFLLNDPREDARIIATWHSPFARVDVVQTNDDSARYIFTDGGAGSIMLRGDGPLERNRSQVDYLPFLAGSTDSVLIIGAGGGRDVVLAQLSGSETITAVEVNPAVIAAVQHFSDYTGDVFRDVTLVEGDARNFVERSTDAYDLIYLNLVYTQAADPASHALVENYIFTEEAFRAYLHRLQPDGRLALVAHNALEGSRAVLTALQALNTQGVLLSDALDHVALWMVPSRDPTLRTTVLIVGRQPIEAEILERLHTRAEQLRMQPIFLPGRFEQLFEPLREGMPMATFIRADADYDLSPTYDDRPYFFNLNFGLPQPIQMAFVLACGLAFALLLLAAFMRTEKHSAQRWPAMIGYAALIGMGFMLVEIPLIQQFQLLLGYPILSTSAVLGALLLAGGAGSWFSQRWPEMQLMKRVQVAAIWIAILAVSYRFALPILINWLLPAPLGLRLLAAVLLSGLFGLALGIPFASLIRTARAQQVPMLWALNGGFTVLGSTLAIVISMIWGFSWALLAGAGFYLLLAPLAARLDGA